MYFRTCDKNISICENGADGTNCYMYKDSGSLLQYD